MSYILDTLKKIEKEKSEIDNKLDLKKMILKDTSEANHIKTLKKRSHLLTFLIVGISIFFFLNFSVFKLPLPSSNPPLDSKGLTGENILKQTQPDSIKNSVDNLPFTPATSSQQKSSQVIEHVLESKNSVSKIANISGEQNPKKSVIQKEANENPETSLVSSDLSDEDLSKSLDSIEQQIKEEKITRKLNQITKEEKKKRLAHNFSSKIISRGAIPRNVANIKISGIVFFGDGATLNYAIASYKGENQIKLKEGDQLDDIEVLKIEPEKILLIFRNKIFERKLGG